MTEPSYHLAELQRRRDLMCTYCDECAIDGDDRNARRFAQLVIDLDRLIAQFRLLFVSSFDTTTKSTEDRHGSSPTASN